MSTTYTASPGVSAETRGLRLILAAGCLLNAVLVLLVIPHFSAFVLPKYGPEFGNHGDLYDLIANNLNQGNGYRIEPGMAETMMREPGYPLFLAGVFRIGGYRIESAEIANLLLAFGIAGLIVQLARKFTSSPEVGAFAAVLFLFYPSTIISETRAGVEVLFTFLLLGFVLLLLHAIERGDPWRFFVAGLALGVTVLTRSTPALFPFFVLGYLLVTTKHTAARMKIALNIAVLIVGIAIVVSPWIIRNYALVHQIVPTATVQGVAMEEGLYTCQCLSGEKDLRTAEREAGRERAEFARQEGLKFEGEYYQIFSTPQDELTFNRALMKSVKLKDREKPLLPIKCAVRNLANFWFLGATWKSTMLNIALQLQMLVLAAFGAWILYRRKRLKLFGVALLLIAYFMAVHAPIIAHARHSVPLIPYLSLLASVSLLSVWHKLRPRERELQK